VQIITISNKADKIKEKDNENILSYRNQRPNINDELSNFNIINNNNEKGNEIGNVANFFNQNSYAYPNNIHNNIPNSLFNKINHNHNHNQNINSTYILCQCRSDVVKYYCRNDNIFLCENCRFNVKKLNKYKNIIHKNHINLIII
jgi:hypothetical protein